MDWGSEPRDQDGESHVSPSLMVSINLGFGYNRKEQEGVLQCRISDFLETFMAF